MEWIEKSSKFWNINIRFCLRLQSPSIKLDQLWFIFCWEYFVTGLNLTARSIGIDTTPIHPGAFICLTCLLNLQIFEWKLFKNLIKKPHPQPQNSWIKCGAWSTCLTMAWSIRRKNNLWWIFTISWSIHRITQPLWIFVKLLWWQFRSIFFRYKKNCDNNQGLLFIPLFLGSWILIIDSKSIL